MPPESTVRRVRAEDAELHLEMIGEGPPLVVLGGIHLSHDYLRPWLDPLGRRARLVYLDHRGTGRSVTEHPEDLDGVGHARWVGDVDAVRRALGHDRIALFGHSYGGFLALEYAVRHPDELAGLILSNTAPVFDFQQQVFENARARGTPEQLEALHRVFTLAPSTDEELKRLWREILPLYFHTWDEYDVSRMEEGTAYSVEAFRQAYGACLPDYDVRDRLSAVRCPVLVLDGADDWIMPPRCAGRRLARGVRQSERFEFDASGHFPFVEEVEQFHEVVARWLRGRKRELSTTEEAAQWS